MYTLSEDFLMTYDPECFEEHSDSTDFEEFDIPTLISKKGKSYLLTDKTRKKNPQKNRSNRNVIKTCSRKNTECVTVRQSETVKLSHIIKDQEKTVKHDNEFNRGDQFKTQPKRSLVRHKVIPCLLIMFGRSSNKMSTIKENDDINVHKDSSCQVQQANWAQRRTRKFNKRHNYTVQPVHTLEGFTHETTPLVIKNDQGESFLYKEDYPKKYLPYDNSTITKLSSKLEHDNRTFKKRFQVELKKEYVKYHSGKFMKHEKQQYPSMQSFYQIFTTPCQQRSKMVSTSSNCDDSFCPKIASTSSGFWHYLFDRFNKKHQTQRMEMLDLCLCDKSTSYPEDIGEHNNFNHSQKLPESDTRICREQLLPLSSAKRSCLHRTSQRESMPLPSLSVQATKKTQVNKKVNCKCHTEKEQSIAHPRKVLTNEIKPCQEPHSQLKNALIKKYNGGILCIHNPQCILINGCLSLPPIKEQKSENVGTTTTDNRHGLCRHSKRKDIKRNCDQGCQHYKPSFEVRQCQTGECKNEILTQCGCNHNPPCEVVRCSCKNKYNFELHECVTASERNKAAKSLKRRPKCTELPIAAKNYTVLTVRDSVGIQTRSATKTFCCHEPPCVMIPKCFNLALQDSYLSYSNVSYCTHRPLCDMIPACCRKTTKKEMVSASSQYPNGCRMV